MIKQMKFRNILPTNKVRLGFKDMPDVSFDNILINGLTGTGKTSLCREMISQAYSRRQIPWVIGYSWEEYCDIIPRQYYLGAESPKVNQDLEKVWVEAISTLSNKKLSIQDLLIIDLDFVRYMLLEDFLSFREENFPKTQIIVASRIGILREWSELYEIPGRKLFSVFARLLIGQSRPVDIEALESIIGAEPNFTGTVNQTKRHHWINFSVNSENLNPLADIFSGIKKRFAVK